MVWREQFGDMNSVIVSDAARFDEIAVSEVLEHIEHPGQALSALRETLAPGGLIFINVPLNSPAPDHIYLLRSEAEARALITSAGLEIVELQLEPMTGLTLVDAIRQRATVSCLVIAR